MLANATPKTGGPAVTATATATPVPPFIEVRRAFRAALARTPNPVPAAGPVGTIAAPIRPRHPLALALDSELQGSLPPTFQLVIDDDTGDLFGFGLALDGDRLFVAAPFSQVGSTHKAAGAFYFFARRPESERGVAWIQSQRAFAPPVSYNAIGFGSATAGDGWAFVTLPGTPDDVDSLGAKDFVGEVLVFRRRDGCGKREPRPTDGYALVQKIPNPLGFPDGAGQSFGFSLSYSDGRLLAAPLFNATAAYVYGLSRNRHHGGLPWELRATLPLPLPAGVASAIVLYALLSGPWAFVGFVPAGSSTGAQGLVAVYRRARCDCGSGSSSDSDIGNDSGCDHAEEWIHTQVLAGTGQGTAADVFGAAIAREGRTLAVGAPADAEHDPRGAVYVFRLSGGVWTQTQKILDDASPSDVLGGQGFGYNVALSRGLLAIADPLRAVSGVDNQGVVAFYERDRCTGRWAPDGVVLSDPNGFRGELFGAGRIAIGREFVAISSNLSPIFINPTPILGLTNPGRVVVWRRLRDPVPC